MDKFFELYVAAFLSLDPASVSEFYTFPVTFFTEEGQTVVLKKDAFLDNSEKLFAIYQKLGVNEIEFQVIDQNDTNSYFSLVSVKWSFLSEDGNEIYSATTRYLVHKELLKISSVITVDEMKNINELLER